MKASQLRDLTRRYATGNVPREQYLVERGRLIDGIVAGEIEIRYRDLDPTDSPARKAASHRHWLFAGGSIMLVGLLLIALLAYFLGDGPTVDRKPPAVDAIDPGTTLLRQFLQSDDWSESAVQQLEQDWNQLTPFHQESARRSADYRRLKHETARRIREQEALLATGQMEALLQATRLQQFAERIGVQPE